MANILITGGAGFIGGSMAGVLAANPKHTIWVIDNLITGSMKKVPVSVHKNIRFVQADVNHRNEIEPLFESAHFEYVFHYAALVGVQRTLEQPTKVLKDIDGIKNILDLCREHRIKRVFYSSSSEVYGEPVHIPQNEHTTPLNSRLPYAIVKNLGEAFLRSYQTEYGLNYGIFRFFNTYGPNQSEDFVISRFLRAALKNEDLTIYGDGSQTRTFCYIDDNIACCKAVFENELFMNDVINVGSDHEWSILELAKEVIKITNSSSRIVHLPALTEGDMTRRKPDISNMNQVMGSARISLEDGIRTLLKSGKIG
jgi:UDP-glucuronate decarboxylase